MPSITKKIGAGKIEAGLTGSESRCGVLNSPKPTTFRNCDSCRKWKPQRKVLSNRDFPKGRIQNTNIKKVWICVSRTTV